MDFLKRFVLDMSGQSLGNSWMKGGARRRLLIVTDQYLPAISSVGCPALELDQNKTLKWAQCNGDSLVLRLNCKQVGIKNKNVMKAMKVGMKRNR